MPPSIISNTAIATAGRVINVSLGLIVIKLLTRFLGPAGYGSYSLLLSFGTLWQLVADFGLYLQLTRSIAEEKKPHTELINTIFSLRAVLLISAFAASLIAAVFIPSLAGLTAPLVLIALGLIFQSFSQLYMGIFQYRQNIWRATLGDILGRLGQIVVVIFFGLKWAALSGMAFAFALSNGLALLVHQTALAPTKPRFTIAWAQWKDMMRLSWPLGALLVLNAIYFRIDTVILSLFRPPAEVGWYGLAYRLIESALFLPAMFGGLLLPRLSEALARRQTITAAQYISQGLTAMLVAAGFIVLTLLLRAREVILLIADKFFLPAAPALMILSLALAAMYFGNIFGFAMIALKKQTALLKLYAALALANTIGNLITIPLWGALAAAATTALTEAAAVSLSGWIIWRRLPYRLPNRSLAGTLLAGSASTAVYYLAPAAWPLGLEIVAALAAYLSIITATKTLTRQNLSLLLIKKP